MGDTIETLTIEEPKVLEIQEDRNPFAASRKEVKIVSKMKGGNWPHMTLARTTRLTEFLLTDSTAEDFVEELLRVQPESEVAEFLQELTTVKPFSGVRRGNVVHRARMEIQGALEKAMLLASDWGRGEVWNVPQREF
jgi:hypothetical protein